jgi:hypothetical protein
MHEDDLPLLSIEDSLPMQIGLIPIYFIIGKSDRNTELPYVSNAARIILLSRTDNDFHGYNLDFEIIGVRR